MNWPSVLENIGVFAVASGLLAWLIKSLVKQSLARDLEAFKSALARAQAIEIEEAKNRFTVGATSHMANVAFDKHVQFCEEYARGVNKALLTLFRRGPHGDVLADAHALSVLRGEWTLWITPEIEGQLDNFERALRRIGAQAQLLKDLRADEDRTDAIKQAYGTFAAVMGWENWRGEPVTRDVAATKVIEGLREVLGTADLTRLRAELIDRASDSLEVVTAKISS